MISILKSHQSYCPRKVHRSWAATGGVHPGVHQAAVDSRLNPGSAVSDPSAQCVTSESVNAVADAAV